MDLSTAAFLLLAGVGGGLIGSTAGLASLISYPALLAVGLPPVAANVTNTVALVSTAVGAAAGSRPELAGQGRRIAQLSALTAVGGTVGAVVLLVTPAESFELVVPWLIALGSLLLLFRNRVQRIHRLRHHRRPVLLVSLTLVAVYGGYFGAAAGVLMLAVLCATTVEPLAVSNAVKNIVLGAANSIAAATYALFAPVDWPAALTLAVGALAGSMLGPAVHRRLPAEPLRVVIALAGLGLAVQLWLSATT
ncbi:MAG: TSUP family transporter [Propionibacteriales bacterium]|nr:TSUP family transporter [Propionibacteriales bacterium]